MWETRECDKIWWSKKQPQNWQIIINDAKSTSIGIYRTVKNLFNLANEVKYIYEVPKNLNIQWNEYVCYEKPSFGFR